MPTDLRSLLGKPAAPPLPADAQASNRAGARNTLEECWKPLWKGVEATLVDVVIEAMSPLARSNDQKDARRSKFVLARDRQFVVAYQETLHTEFEGALKDFIANKPTETPADRSPGLSLVDYDAMELSTLVERGAARIRNSADEVYGSLKARVARAVNEPEIRESENPFRAAIFYHAAFHALERIGTAHEDVFPLLEHIGAALSKSVVAAYRAVDERLKAEGFSGDVAPPSGWRSTFLRGGPEALAGETEAQAVALNRGVSADNVLRALYERMQLAPAGRGVGAPGMPVGSPMIGDSMMPGVGAIAGGMPAGLGAAPGAPYPTAAVHPAGAAAVSYVDGLGKPAGGTAAGVIGSGLIVAINEIQKLSALALSAAQRGAAAPDAAIDAGSLRGRLVEKADRQVDKLTIELVGLLFERISQDKHVPREIKELLQRLQFPMIKVALMDPELFVAADQPARRLIDRIASTSVGWINHGDENRRYFAEAQRAVHAVLAATDEGVGVFERALAEFEKYLSEERTRDDDPVTRAKRALAEAEDSEVMAINATIKIRSAFDGVQVESYLKDFLLGTWSQVLAAAWRKDKTDQNSVRRYLAIVPDLVWSVQPKFDADDRKRLVTVIPKVLARLREGLALIQRSPAESQAFFAQLMTSHAQAVKAVELAHGVGSSDFDPGAMRSDFEGFRLDRADVPSDLLAQARVPDRVVKEALMANQANVEYIEVPAAADADPGDLSDGELDQLIAKWRRGDWFSLRRGDVTERVRLRWVSPLRKLYLFTPADGARAHSLAPDALRALVRKGELRPVEPAPLFDRAVHGVMLDLQHTIATQPA